MNPHNDIAASTAAGLEPVATQARSGAESWIFTHDHRRLALLYAIVIALAAVVGSFLAVGLALQPLADHDAGTSAEEYRRLYSMHGLVMVFLVALPAIPSVLGNWLLPEQVGVEGMAWPRLNLLAFHLLLAGCALFLVAFFTAPVDTGWSLDAPFSVTSSASLSWGLLGLLAIGVSYACNGANVLATLVTSRKRAGERIELSECAWSLGFAALVQVLSVPALISAVVVLLAQRSGATDLLGALAPARDVQFNDWFWSFAHPAFTAALLCALGVVFEIISAHTSSSNGARWSTVISLLAITVISCAAFGVHSLGRETSPDDAPVSSALALASGIPFAVIVVRWWTMLWQRPIRATTALCYALSFIVFLVVGGLGGLFLAVLPTGIYLQNTTFATAQLHYLIAGGVLSAGLAGVHHVWPRWFGVPVREGAGMATCALFFVGMNLAFLPQFVLGYLGAPRRSGLLVEGASQWSWISAIGSALIIGALAFAAWNLVATLFEERDTRAREAGT